jgi:hypothetical protein
MPKLRVQSSYNHLPPPPLPPTWCAYEAVEIAHHLASKHRARKWQVEYLLGMLDECYIVKLPRLKRDRNQIYERSPQHLRWLWCTWAAKLLGWKTTRPEGHLQGFLVAIYKALHEVVFPFPKVERDHDRGGISMAGRGGCGSQGGTLTSGRRCTAAAAKGSTADSTSCASRGAAEETSAVGWQGMVEATGADSREVPHLQLLTYDATLHIHIGRGDISSPSLFPNEGCNAYDEQNMVGRGRNQHDTEQPPNAGMSRTDSVQTFEAVATATKRTSLGWASKSIRTPPRRNADPGVAIDSPSTTCGTLRCSRLDPIWPEPGLVPSESALHHGHNVANLHM